MGCGSPLLDSIVPLAQSDVKGEEFRMSLAEVRPAAKPDNVPTAEELIGRAKVA
jgi:hypothetical protein